MVSPALPGVPCHRPGIRNTRFLITTAILSITTLLSAAASHATDPPAAETSKVDTSKASAGAQMPYFTEVAAQAGVDFVHDAGRSGQFYFPEMAGPGGALFDADGDGDLDLYLVQGGPLGPTVKEADRTGDRLFRNDTPVGNRPASLRFTDITVASGIRASGYGMGAAAGDIDSDGDLDLYVANFGANQLWRNQGTDSQGMPRFESVAEAGGTAGNAWSSGALFFDADHDGLLDLYVIDYVDFSYDNNVLCYASSSRRDYCGPQAFNPISDHLYRNLGAAEATSERDVPRFEDVTRHLLRDYRPGSGLGAAVFDADNDGDLDLYVANDGEANQLWLRQDDGTYLDEALFAGVAVNSNGSPEASMGIAVGDPDHDGDDDLFITHLTAETNTFYTNQGDGLFEDKSTLSGLGAPSLPWTGFGTAWLDLDGNGWLDLAVVNGAVRIQDALAARGDDYPLAQRNQLFLHRGLASAGHPTFEEVSDQGGAAFGPARGDHRETIGRGLLVGDLDNDGDRDLVVIDNEGAAQVLRNDLDPVSWLGLRLLDGARDAYGARVAIALGDGRVLWRRAGADGSYAASNDPRAVVSLTAGGTDTAKAVAVSGVTVLWPGGERESFPVPPSNQYSTLRRGAGKMKP